MSNKKLVLLIGGAVAIAILGAGYYYFSKPKESGTVDTAESVSKIVPEIVTNPAEKVPEVNPLDRANPFKYNNPLR